MKPHAGKGVAYLTVANFSFFVSSYLLYFALARILPVDSFGVYSLVISIATMVNVIFVEGIQQSVSKFISEGRGLAVAIRNRVLKFTVLTGIILFACFFLFAEQIALLFNDIALAPYIRIVGSLLITHPLYATFTGFFNGLREFKTQAKLKISYSIMKLVFILALAFITHSIWGALAGFIAASLSAFLLGAFLGRGRPNKGEFSLLKLFKFAFPITLFVFSMNLLLGLDLFLLKILSLQQLSNLQVAYYTSASTISRAPYFAIMAFSMVLLPTISGLQSKNNIEKIRSHILKANRYAFMILTPIVLFIFVTAGQLVSLAYTARYAAGAGPLSILIFALGLFSIFHILSAVVSGSGRPVVPFIITLFALALSFALNIQLIPAFGLKGAAMSTFIAMAFAFVMISLFVFYLFKVFVSAKAILRIAIAGAVSAAALQLILLPGALLVASYSISSVIYIAILFVLRELNGKDVELFRAIIRRSSIA